MKILGYDPFVSKEQIDENEIKLVELEELISKSDFITLHLPINDTTRNLFNYETISKMKKTSRLINVARGGIINEKDLAKALNDEVISGAAIDVFVEEPIPNNHILLKTKNILLTPHLGASTIEAKAGVTFIPFNPIRGLTTLPVFIRLLIMGRATSAETANPIPWAPL